MKIASSSVRGVPASTNARVAPTPQSIKKVAPAISRREDEVIGQSHAGDSGLDVSSQDAITNKQEADVWISADNLGRCIKDELVALEWEQPCDLSDDYVLWTESQFCSDFGCISWR